MLIAGILANVLSVLIEDKLHEIRWARHKLLGQQVTRQQEGCSERGENLEEPQLTGYDVRHPSVG